MSVMPTDIESRLTAAASAGIHYGQTTDAKGVVTAWCRLAASEDLLAVASLLKTMGTRLSTITVFQPKAPPEPPKAKEGEIPAPVPTFFGGVIQDGKTYEIDYHFDLRGV